MNLNDINNGTSWMENVIIVDGDYIDKLAFDLTVNFERMLGRRIQKADMGMWVDCIALDGGLKPGNNKVQVVILYSMDKLKMENFEPSNYSKELSGVACTTNLGEFTFSSFPVIESITSKEGFFLDILSAAASCKEVKRIMVIPNAEEYYDKVRTELKSVDDDDKRITVFAMQPMTGGNYRQEILGYSLMAALGIRGEEIG